MSKKGGKGGGEKKNPERKIVLKKDGEEKRTKGHMISLVATVIENDKPVTGKSISFFCGDKHIGEGTTDDNGTAYCQHLLRSGTHTITATSGSTRSNAITTTIGYQVNDAKVVILEEIKKRDDEHIIVIQALDDKNKPIVGAKLRAWKNGVSFVVDPTDEYGITRFTAMVNAPRVTVVIEFAASPSINAWTTLYKTTSNKKPIGFRVSE